ncbi:MAG: Asp-tRNA(Asn)/Glu-tRNA(Gln) amidotransferase subunit GatC [bacterium]
MKTTSKIDAKEVAHLAKLAALSLSPQQQTELQSQLISTLEYVRAVQQAPTENTPETTQVTGLHNVWREDVVEDTRILTQDQARANSKSTYQGYFLVPAILE